MEFQKSEYFQKRAHKFHPSISRGSRLLKRGFRLLKSTQSSLSRDFCCLAISLLPRGISTASLSSPGVISPFSSFFHRTRARKSPERLFSPSQHTPESFPTTPPEISRFMLHLDISTASLSSSGAISPFSSFIGRPPESFPRGFPFRVCVLQKVFRKFPEGLFSPIQRTPESFPTTPPEISRFPFGTKVIKILDLSPYLPPTRPFAVSPTLSYSPKPVLHQPRHQTESTPLVHQSPSTIYPHLTLSYNNTHKSSSSPTTPPDRIRSSRSSISLHVLSSSHPVLQQHSSVQFITSYNYQVRFPDRSIRIVILQTGNSQLATHGIARNLKRSAPM